MPRPLSRPRNAATNELLEAGLQDPGRATLIFNRRVLLALLLVLLALGGIVARLYQLQVRSHEHYSTLSTDNRIKVQPLPPTRGQIYDRVGRLLADNLPSYALEIVPEKVDDLQATIDGLAEIIAISAEDRQRFERLLTRRRRFEGVPIRLDLDEAERARFAVKSHLFPGVDIHAELLRWYPEGQYTAHVVGYVGRINEREMKEIDTSDYAGTSHIGKVGVERYHEDRLHGTVGVEQVEVNARGRLLRVVDRELPIAGRDLHLFLDIDLQKAATAALGDRRGAVVAIEPATGGVLALVSAPSYDPNPFVGGISVAGYAALRDDIDKPLYNRAIRGQYPPGSTIKPFVALGGLATGKATFGGTKFCGGYYQLPGQSHRYRCWRRGGHGSISMRLGIVQSCDVYFYRLAHDMGIDTLDGFLSKLSFGRPTGADIAGEQGGLLPSPAWKERVRHEIWYPGETLIVGIGQGAFLATPLQLAAATAAVANRGTYIRPRLVKATRPPGVKSLEPTAPVTHRLPVQDPHHFDQIIGAMSDVVQSRSGTAWRIRSDHYDIAGKTGTAQVFTVGQNEWYNEAQVAERMRDHALFVAFAPVEHPRIAVAVIVENGGHGGSTAAPVARAVMDAWLVPGLTAAEAAER